MIVQLESHMLSKSLSHVRLFETQWTVAHHARLCMGFSRQEYWSGVPLPSPVTTHYHSLSKNDSFLMPLNNHSPFI